MTDHTPTPDRATGPTPEEISARLEVLLKRTHALRQARRISDASPDGAPTWPPSDHDLAAVEVVDVPVTSMMRGDAARPSGDGTASQPARDPAAPRDPVAGDDRGVGQQGGRAAPASTPAVAPSTADRDLGGPDWSAVHLRDASMEAPGTPAWISLVIAALVVALGAETAYLLHTRPWAAGAAAADTQVPVSLRIEGYTGARVRVNDEPPRSLPLDHTTNGEAIRLTILAPGASPSVPAASSSSSSSASQGAVDAGPDPLAAADAVTATTGAVYIESTPAGAIVTMEGRERGPTPITIPRLRPGRHDVMLTGPRGRRALKVNVRAGQITRLDASTAAR